MVEHLNDAVSLWLVLLATFCYFAGLWTFRISKRSGFAVPNSTAVSYFFFVMLIWLTVPILTIAQLHHASSGVMLHWLIWALVNTVFMSCLGIVELLFARRWRGVTTLVDGVALLVLIVTL